MVNRLGKPDAPGSSASWAVAVIPPTGCGAPVSDDARAVTLRTSLQTWLPTGRMPICSESALLLGLLRNRAGSRVRFDDLAHEEILDHRRMDVDGMAEEQEPRPGEHPPMSPETSSRRRSAPGASPRAASFVPSAPNLPPLSRPHQNCEQLARLGRMGPLRIVELGIHAPRPFSPRLARSHKVLRLADDVGARPTERISLALIRTVLEQAGL